MRSSSLVLLLTFAFASACTADDTVGETSNEVAAKPAAAHRKHHGADPVAHATKLQDKLGLSDQQTAKVEAILREEVPQAQRYEKLQAVLTADQVTELKQLHKGHKNRKGHMGHAKFDPAEKVAKLKVELALTDEQANRISTAYTDLKQQFGALHEAMRQAKEGTAKAEGFSAIKAKKVKIMAAHKQRVESILTAEQLPKFRAMSQGHGHACGSKECDHKNCDHKNSAHGGDCPHRQ